MLEQEINDNVLDINHDKLQLLEQKKTSLVNIRRQKIEGVMLRFRGKINKTLLNLENRNYTSKTISKLIDEDGNEYIETNDILRISKRILSEIILKKWRNKCKWYSNNDRRKHG